MTYCRWALLTFHSQLQAYEKKKECELTMPHVIKRVLVNDWDNICRKKLLVSLPKDANVRVILDDYVASKNWRADDAERVEFVKGLKEYFDSCIGSVLLYKYERAQYHEVLRTHKVPMSEVYGGEHLLRMFVKMPELLVRTAVPADELKICVERIDDILRFLTKHQKSIFASSYIEPDEDYSMLMHQ